MQIMVSLFMDPRFSIVLAPLVVATYTTLFIYEVFDRQTDQL